MSARETFPNLWQFIGGSFHEDWMHDAPTPEGVIELYLKDATAQEIAGVRSELVQLLNQTQDDASLLATLTELGCTIYFPALGVTPSQWLADVRAQVSRSSDVIR